MVADSIARKGFGLRKHYSKTESELKLRLAGGELIPHVLVCLPFERKVL
jgi:hypothetical protein